MRNTTVSTSSNAGWRKKMRPLLPNEASHWAAVGFSSLASLGLSALGHFLRRTLLLVLHCFWRVGSSHGTKHDQSPSFGRSFLASYLSRLFKNSCTGT